MAQPMYYGQPYQMPQSSQYAQHPQAPSHHQSMTSAPCILMSHQQPQQPLQQTPQSVHSQPSMMDSKPSQQSIPCPPSVLAPPHRTPQTPSGSAMGNMPPGSAGSGPNSSVAPGPIPASTPLVVRQDALKLSVPIPQSQPQLAERAIRGVFSFVARPKTLTLAQSPAYS